MTQFLDRKYNTTQKKEVVQVASKTIGMMKFNINYIYKIMAFLPFVKKGISNANVSYQYLLSKQKNSRTHRNKSTSCTKKFAQVKFNNTKLITDSLKFSRPEKIDILRLTIATTLRHFKQQETVGRQICSKNV